MIGYNPIVTVSGDQLHLLPTRAAPFGSAESANVVVTN